MLCKNRLCIDRKNPDRIYKYSEICERAGETRSNVKGVEWDPKIMEALRRAGFTGTGFKQKETQNDDSIKVQSEDVNGETSIPKDAVKEVDTVQDTEYENVCDEDQKEEYDEEEYILDDLDNNLLSEDSDTSTCSRCEQTWNSCFCGQAGVTGTSLTQDRRV